MKIIVYIVTILALFALNAGMFANLQFFSGVPNLLLLLVYVLSLEKNDQDFMMVALVAGLLLDFYSGTFVGSFALAFMLLGGIVQAVTTRFLAFDLTWKYVVGMFVVSYVFVYGFVWSYGMLMFRVGWAVNYIDFSVLITKLLPELGYNILLLYPIYALSDFLKEFIERTNRRSYSR